MTIRAVNQSQHHIDEWVKDTADIINRMQVGRSNCTTSVTLTANVASTTVTDERIAYNSVILLMPKTANASAEIGNGTIYISDTGRVNGSVVITHANNAQSDRSFGLVIIG